MAAADYWSCDKCGGKSFYDSELDYDGYSRPAHLRADGRILPSGAGDMAALCVECAKTHEIVVRQKPAADAMKAEQ